MSSGGSVAGSSGNVRIQPANAVGIGSSGVIHVESALHHQEILVQSCFHQVTLSVKDLVTSLQLQEKDRTFR